LDGVNLDRIAQDLAGVGLTLPTEVVAEIALSEGRPDEALWQAESACSEAEHGGLRPAYVAALELQLRVQLRLDRPGDVVSLADVGVQMAGELGYRPLLWRIRAAKAQALEMLGEMEAAAQQYRVAAEIIRELADTVPDAELRQGFLSDAFVSSIIAASGSGTREKEV
jgi:hypothetical protein